MIKWFEFETIRISWFTYFFSFVSLVTQVTTRTSSAPSEWCHCTAAGPLTRTTTSDSSQSSSPSPPSAMKVTDPSVAAEPRLSSSVVEPGLSSRLSVCLFSGGALRRHHGSRQRRERLRGILCHLPPLPHKRRVQQHSHIWLCRWATGSDPSCCSGAFPSRHVISFSNCH